MKKQNGISVIEFSIVSTVLLICLFGVLELSKFVFSLQMLNEMTRKAARMATVCEIDQGSVIPGLNSIISIAPTDYEPSMLKIDYLDDTGVTIYSGTGTITNEDFLEIKFVRAKVENFSFGFTLLSSLLGDNVGIPAFETILPSESLGIYRPDGDGNEIAGPSCL
ncbi:TadE family protein [Vibrio comitans]|nr:TadE/TadG family type IV pilus assembly protein [Vibrio comitans]